MIWAFLSIYTPKHFIQLLIISCSVTAALCSLPLINTLFATCMNPECYCKVISRPSLWLDLFYFSIPPLAPPTLLYQITCLLSQNPLLVIPTQPIISYSTERLAPTTFQAMTEVFIGHLVVVVFQARTLVLSLVQPAPQALKELPEKY